jgi:hypothetical protein
LLKVNRIDIENNNIICYDNDYHCNETYMGLYNSKERALEILDEIQNSILGILSLEDIEKQEIKKYTGKATFSKVTNQLVYIMPEE